LELDVKHDHGGQTEHLGKGLDPDSLFLAEAEACIERRHDYLKTRGIELESFPGGNTYSLVNISGNLFQILEDSLNISLNFNNSGFDAWRSYPVRAFALQEDLN